MEAIFGQLKTLIAAAGDKGRSEALDAIRKLQYSLETHYDVTQRIASMGLELPMLQIGSQLKIYNILHESKQPMTVSQLSEKTGAPEVTLVRILRHLAAVGTIQETAKDTYGPNKMTENLADDGMQGLIYHSFETAGPLYQALPGYLKERNYADVTNPTDTAFSKAYHTDLPVFAWIPQQTEKFSAFQKAMVVQQVGVPTWFSVFPFKKELGSFAGPTVFVDVGGGFGHQCLALEAAYPELTGKLVLQELPQTLEHVPDHKGMEKQVHDFFTPNPVKGAKFYYLRCVLHDWPDDKAVVILKHLKDAMGPESEILLDEIVMPNVGAHCYSTGIDLNMMAALAARERTDEQWRKLLDAADLKIKSITKYIAPKGESIIVVVPK